MLLRILHLEDHPDDAFFVEQALSDLGIPASINQVHGHAAFATALESEPYDLILADHAMPGFTGLQALEMARKKLPETPIICLSGNSDRKQIQASFAAGASDCVHKDNLRQLAVIIERYYQNRQLTRRNRAMKCLVSAVQELSLARDLPTVMAIVRHAARELTGADGATFVLREGECCHYADEDAISPLWKGQRFPLSSCISGWVMLNREPAVIEDIYKDPRIPADAYRPTFVKSLAMVPIRPDCPLGAIGNYWAQGHLPTTEEVELLQTLANTTAVAMENIQIHDELEQRVKSRTAQLEAANHELEAFSYAVSHDLGAPLRSIQGFSGLLLQKSTAKLDKDENLWVQKIRNAGDCMGQLIDDLLRLSQVVRAELKLEQVDLSQLARDIVAGFSSFPARQVDVNITCDLIVDGDRGLLKAALENLLSNAWKYTSKTAQPCIEVGSTEQQGQPCVYYVRDNGAGFNMVNAKKLFQPFNRLHSDREFAGNGIGLATVQRIIQRHGGQIWAEAAVDKGATFYFTLGNKGEKLQTE
ncbi:ATP-binding protein [Pedosphaera parvula]|uniref:histidine kinase n=1 Tax=Pedosphaera parvula (strain Ellin514) TaxID=320771 RepID=B9XMG2_PEDPL|nr:ATP-binding protein [Pedosphaera parvula]EEF59004.1 multi-sensor signal transduction histidine kinase [Pedosphaera parvula Ellin514]